jgi:hypothetical protein
VTGVGGGTPCDPRRCSPGQRCGGAGRAKVAHAPHLPQAMINMLIMELCGCSDPLIQTQSKMTGARHFAATQNQVSDLEFWPNKSNLVVDAAGAVAANRGSASEPPFLPWRQPTSVLVRPPLTHA